MRFLPPPRLTLLLAPHRDVVRLCRWLCPAQLHAGRADRVPAGSARWCPLLGVCSGPCHVRQRESHSRLRVNPPRSRLFPQLICSRFWTIADSQACCHLFLILSPAFFPHLPLQSGLYQYALVSDSLNLSLFVLARNVTDYYINYDAEVQKILLDAGFTNFLNKPIQTVQTNCSGFPTDAAY